MPGVIGRRRTSLLVGSALALALGAPSLASAQDLTTTTTTATAPADQVTAPAVKAAGKSGSTRKQPGPASARVSVFLPNVHKHKLSVGNRARAVGYLKPFVAGQDVKVQLLRHGKVVAQANREVKKDRSKNRGVFHFESAKLVKPGSFKVVATHEKNAQLSRDVARSPKFHITYPDLDPGNRNSNVKTFNKLLKKQGYFTSGGKTYSVRTQWAVMAVRKVNGMSRSYNANPKIFRMLAARKAEFHLAYPHKGKHVEVDISKQVMALATHGKAQYTFAVSTGAPATPTIRGHFHFYRKDPGYNSEGMYYSVYFIRGYATHGYNPVPPYPASHGCVRNPIPDSIFIYNWIDLGDSIYVYL
jgi:lipoprotein-anchoring transpeptidase ErfK/SrfK